MDDEELYGLARLQHIRRLTRPAAVVFGLVLVAAVVVAAVLLAAAG